MSLQIDLVSVTTENGSFTKLHYNKTKGGFQIWWHVMFTFMDMFREQDITNPQIKKTPYLHLQRKS